MSTNKIAIVGLMTSITCILGPISIAIPISPVPISLGLFGILLTTILLGAKLGTISCFLYILLGAVGLPVFSGFTSGIGVLLGPTGGYLIGYLFVALLSEFFIHGQKHLVLLRTLGIILGLMLCYFLGSIWLAGYMDISLSNALLIGVLPYIPADIFKLAVALWLGGTLRRRLNRAGLL